MTVGGWGSVEDPPPSPSFSQKRVKKSNILSHVDLLLPPQFFINKKSSPRLCYI